MALPRLINSINFYTTRNLINSMFKFRCILFFYLVLSHSTYSLQIITENFKALKGETVRLECPQPDPTWFFRSSDREIEDLIVTRHGIINVDYKYKITCHPVLKHQTISINKVDIEDEGIYSCLYTSTAPSKSSNENDGEIIAVQHRLNFNVSVYSNFFF